MSKITWVRLSEADQKLIKEAAKEATTLQRNLMAEADEKLLAEYKKLPTLQINVADQTPFKAATQKVWDAWAEAFRRFRGEKLRAAAK